MFAPVPRKDLLALASGRSHIEPMADCQRCQGERWVRENHPDKPWNPKHQVLCGGAGMPCPDCNQPREGERPDMGDDFVRAFDRDKGPIH